MNQNIILVIAIFMPAISALAQAIPWEIEEELQPVIYPFTTDPKTAKAKYKNEIKFKSNTCMRRRDGSFPPTRTYAEIMEDLNNASDEFKHTILYQRLVMKADMLRVAEETRDK